MEDSDFYIRKAQQCRRLAASINSPQDPAIFALIALAEEYEAKAALYWAERDKDAAGDAKMKRRF